ncbi:hypothetical protein PROFUN_05074 [Planoprotostelium fungivorum]|uniref:PPM-type phosphatase domain-containing protein n=1 Tax=Planoprotostelium fungivorum TaxID=1890364 RepID=A0A2P6NSC2_9EUKA|nr:hypothetical protein PROFUN_05074 [Planoprotostelium fungivorum]
MMGDVTQQTSLEGEPSTPKRKLEEDVVASPSMVSLKRHDIDFVAGFITRTGDRQENQDDYLGCSSSASLLQPVDPSPSKRSRTRGASVKTTTGPAIAVPVWGVMDGHGPLGQKAARLCVQEVQKIMGQAPADITEETLKKELTKAISAADVVLHQQSVQDDIEYGTTLNLAMLANWLDPLSPNKLIVANVGDTRCVLFRRVKKQKTEELQTNAIDTAKEIAPISDIKTGGNTEEEVIRDKIVQKSQTNETIPPPPTDSPSTTTKRKTRSPRKQSPRKKAGAPPTESELLVDILSNDDTSSTPAPRAVPDFDVEIIPLSEDHCLTRTDEVDRIRTTTTGQIGVGRSGMMRVCPSIADYTKEMIIEKRLALNMSRALGHPILRLYGVIAEPEWREVEVKPDDLVLLASDGLWEIMTNEQVAEIVRDQWDVLTSTGMGVQKLCNSLSKECALRHKNADRSADNCTMVMIYFYEKN